VGPQTVAPPQALGAWHVKLGGDGTFESDCMQSIDTASMNSGKEPIIGMSETFTKPGRYTVVLPCPKSRATALVRIEMWTPSGVAYVDEFPQSFHMHFDKLLKWLVAAPLLCMGLFLLVLQPDAATVLPTNRYG
jgi:hypothetical protein